MDLNNLIKNKRVLLGYSLREFEKITGINYQQINRYEENKIEISSKNLNTMLDILNINKDSIVTDTNVVSDCFDKFYLDLYFGINDLSVYKIKFEQLKNSSAENLYKLYLMRFMISVTCLEIEIAQSLDKQLEKIAFEEINTQALYFEYKGMLKFHEKKHDEAIEFLNKSLSICTDMKIISLIYYHLLFVYKDLNYNLLALECAKKAESLFAEFNNLDRIIGCKQFEGMIYLRTRNYDKSESKYLDCISLIEKDNEWIAQIYRNLCWCMIKKQDYIKALLYLDKAKEIVSENSLMDLYYIWIYYCKSDYYNAFKMLKKVDKLKLENEYRKIYSLFADLVNLKNKPTLKILNKATSVYNYFSKCNDIDLIIFYLDIVINLYLMTDDYKKLAYYQSEKIKYLEKTK